MNKNKTIGIPVLWANLWYSTLQYLVAYGCETPSGLDNIYCLRNSLMTKFKNATVLAEHWQCGHSEVNNIVTCGDSLKLILAFITLANLLNILHLTRYTHNMVENMEKEELSAIDRIVEERLVLFFLFFCKNYVIVIIYMTIVIVTDMTISQSVRYTVKLV